MCKRWERLHRQVVLTLFLLYSLLVPESQGAEDLAPEADSQEEGRWTYRWTIGDNSGYPKILADYDVLDF